MKKKLTRLFSVLLAAVLVLGTLPVSAMGTDVADPPASAVDDTPAEVSAAEPEEASVVDETPDGEKAQSGEVEAAATYAPADVQYKIVHLDCGRKYFSKDWIIALLYEMKNDGYNQLQLAFGNDGLRFLLNDMSFTANGTAYGNDTVVAKVKEGNKAQNSSGDERYLTEAEMDEIIDKANELGIEIVPLLNLPGHANAILDIANDAYNASGSQNTLNVASDAGVNFGVAIFRKYVNYFAAKGCQFFNFGADEYANDTTGSFGSLSDTTYNKFVTFIGDLATIVDAAGMTPRAFNDGFYYKGKTMTPSEDLQKTEICYWSSGWPGYDVASASTISGNGHKMINTNGDFYYVLGKDDKFDSDYSYASNFTNSGFMGSTISKPVGSMFCIWCDYPNAETEQEVAANTRLVLRAMAQRMNNETVSVRDNVVANGFNADGTINVPEDPNKVVITVNGNGSKLVVGSSVEMAASKMVRWTANNDNVEITPASDTAAYSTDVEAAVVNIKAVAAGKVTITATDPADESNTDSVELNVVTEDYDEEIKLTVGETYTLKDVDGAYNGDLLPGDTVATVTGAANTLTSKYKAVTTFASGANECYVSTRANANSIDSNKAKITVEYTDGNYYLKNENGKYIYPANGKVVESNEPVAVTFIPYSGGFTVSYNYYYLSVSNNALTGGWGGYTLYFYKDAVQNSTITFTGKSVGTTNVTIGDTNYKITVSPTPLTIEYWITNRRVTGSDQATQKKLTAERVASGGADGVDIKDLVPPTGTHEEHKMVFWKATRLQSPHKQTADGGVDKTQIGDDFTKIRYYENKWSFWDGTKWEDFNTKEDQIVAYYMQVTDVTDEVTTEVVDWGQLRKTYNDYRYVLLDFAVKYQSSDTRVPNTFPNGKTVAFHCDTNDATSVHLDPTTKEYYRTIGRIDAAETANYEVYMITLTPHDDNASKYLTTFDPNTVVQDGTIEYSGTEKVVWVDDENNLGDFADKEKAAGYSVGGEPSVPSLNIYSRHAMLVTYYLRAKETDTSLNVKYVDETTNKEFYSYIINAKGADTVFEKNIGLNQSEWKGNLDHATIMNVENREETVSADLDTMKAVPVHYRHAANYICTDVKRSENGKTVTLYYTFDHHSAFVVDFGMPLTITKEQVSENLKNAEITGVKLYNVTCGTATASADGKGTITYTPGKDFAKSAYGGTFEAVYTVKSNAEENKTGYVAYSITVYPASNVLYEEGFLSVGQQEQYTSNAYTWKEDKGTHSQPQQTQKTTDADKFTFGYDSIYDNVTKENGAWKITGLNISDLSVPLTTTFYGNGFDLIGNCANDSGRVMIMIKGKENKLIVVDTRYNDGKGGNTVLNQVPLAHVVMSEEGTYEVKVYTAGLDPISVNGTSNQSLATASLYEDYTANDMISEILEANDLSTDDVEIVTTAMLQDGVASPVTTAISQDGVASPAATVSLDDVATYATTVVPHPAGTHVEINGFRVYRSSAVSETTDDNTAAKPVAENYPEAEQNKTYWNILDVVKGNITAYTEADKNAVSVSVEEYEGRGGPQNEIFLTKDHAVQFQIDNLKGKTIYVSLRAVKNATSYNGESISSVTEMYYPITANDQGVFTISCDRDNMLAIGNVKLPSGIKATDIKSPSEVNTAVLVAALNEVLHDDEEKEVFTPEAFKVTSYSTKLVKNKVVTLKINVSSDVAYVTVNGVKYTRSGLQGLFQKTRTIRVVKTVPKNEEKSYEIIAYNADGVASETTTITVK